jgi:hypothetical protein
VFGVRRPCYRLPLRTPLHRLAILLFDRGATQ